MRLLSSAFLFLLALSLTPARAQSREAFKQQAIPARSAPGAAALTPLPPRPARYEPVTDLAALLRPAEAAQLRGQLLAFEQRTTTQIVLVLLPTIGTEPIEKVSQRLFAAWGPGQARLDNGLLVLVEAREHTVRIHTGYGLEGVVPDEAAARIIKQTLVPAFRKQQYHAGLASAVTQLMHLASQRQFAGSLPH